MVGVDSHVLAVPKWIMFPLLGSIAFAQEVLQVILNSIQSQNVDAIIAEAERILEEIKRRDFSLDESAANNEYGLANESEFLKDWYFEFAYYVLKNI